MTFNVHDVPNVKAFMVFRSMEHVEKAAKFYKMDAARLNELKSCMLHITLPGGAYLMLPTIRPIYEDGTPSFPSFWSANARAVYAYQPLVGMVKVFDSGSDISKEFFDMFPTVEKYFDKLMGRQTAHRSGA